MESTSNRQRSFRLKAFVAFALVLSVSNSYYFSFRRSLPTAAFASPPTESTEIQAREEESPSNKPILFTHFHKSGGTHACKVLKSSINITDAAGKPVNYTKFQTALLANCNTAFSGPNADVKLFSSLQTCRHLLPYAVDDDYKPRMNVVAVEVPFEDSMPCEGWTSFAIMRDPIARLQSHMLAHNDWKEERIINLVKERKPCPESYYMDGYPIVNSMVIRQLLGRERFIDARPVDKDDLQQAKQIVDAFDAFVPMEHLYHPNVQELLNKTVPEYVQGQEKLPSRKDGTEKSYNASSEFLQLITEENKYDILLYQYVLEKLGIASE